jgi:hypothetical protein
MAVSVQHGLKRETLTGVDLRLAIQRKMVGVFGHEHLGDGAVRGQPALNQSGRRGGLHHPILTGAAGVLRAADDHNPDLGRHDVEALGHILADAVQGAGAARADRARDVYEGLNPRQVGRQRSAVDPTLGGPGRLLGGRGLFGLGVPGGLDLLGLFQSQRSWSSGRLSARRPKR